MADGKKKSRHETQSSQQRRLRAAHTQRPKPRASRVGRKPINHFQGARRIEFITNTRKRSAAFCKRRDGLIKKVCSALSMHPRTHCSHVTFTFPSARMQFAELCQMTQCEGMLILRSPTGCLFKSASDHLLPVTQNQRFLDAFARALPPPLPRFLRTPETLARRQRLREARALQNQAPPPPASPPLQQQPAPQPPVQSSPPSLGIPDVHVHDLPDIPSEYSRPLWELEDPFVPFGP